jgi:hypothetical protein
VSIGSSIAGERQAAELGAGNERARRRREPAVTRLAGDWRRSPRTVALRAEQIRDQDEMRLRPRRDRLDDRLGAVAGAAQRARQGDRGIWQLAQTSRVTE